MTCQEKLAILRRFGKDVARERNVAKTIEFLSGVIRDLVEAERCSIFVLDRDKNELWTTYAQGVDREIRVPADKGVVSYAALSREAQVVVDAYEDFRFNRSVDEQTGYLTKNIVAVPLFTQYDEVFGVVEVLNKHAVSFTVEDVETLNMFGNYVAYVLESKLLYEEMETKVRERTEALEELNRTLEEKVKVETEKRLSHERALIQNAKMAEMGEMISAITHQWKNPIGVIALIAQGVQMDCEEGGECTELRKQMENIVQQTDFLSDTISAFRNFLKPARTPTLFDVTEAIKDVIRLLDPLFATSRTNLSISREGSRLLMVRGLKSELMQVFMNLFINGEEAILERKAAEGSIRVLIREESPETILLQVDDNGGGVPEEALEKIFDNYFTTKGETGTGVGLYLARNIIQRMNGTIRAENLYDGRGERTGVRFTIVLPQA